MINPRLYTDEGWVNIRGVLDTGLPFIFLVGGRGIGKTYGALQEALRQEDQFLILRRRQTQADIISAPDMSPLAPIAPELEYKKISKYVTAVTKPDENRPRAFIAALSTFYNLRGFDASGVNLIIYDEFIGEPHERGMRDEAEALLNCYESINRNRELVGRKPVQLLALANSEDIANPYFLRLNLVDRAERMRKTGIEWWSDEGRGIGMGLLTKSRISEAKAKTALYRLGDERYNDMALNSSFGESYRNQSLPIKGMHPVVRFGEITIYRNPAGGLYVSTHKSGSPPTYPAEGRAAAEGKRRFMWIAPLAYSGKIVFESRAAEEIFFRVYDFTG